MSMIADRYVENLLPVTIALALGSHLVFNIVEPRRPSLIIALLILPPVIITLTTALFASKVEAIALSWTFFKTCAIYFSALSSSLIFYRISPIHPLANYPGPLICKITRLWAAYVLLVGKQHEYQKSLHERYGPFVRTGPNHLHISDPGALPIVMAAQPFKRGERYGLFRIPGSSGSLINIIDPNEHSHRRKTWEKGLNVSAIQDYGDTLSIRVEELINCLEARQNEIVNMSKWLSWFSFDFMGDLGFGKSFDLLKNGDDKHQFTAQTHLASQYIELASKIPWTGQFLNLLGPRAGLKSLRTFALESVLARMKQESTRKDIFHHLLGENQDSGGSSKVSLGTLVQEAGLVIIAGSDTTGTALSNLFYFLLSHPQVYARLQAEIDQEFPRDVDIFADTSILSQNMKYLNAVINETLRLRPAVPSGILRQLYLGDKGTMVLGRWIPEGTTVQISAFTIHQDPQYFSPNPTEFIPERWLDNELGPDHVLDQSAYFPFSRGPTNCAGKHLALFELRAVVCSLLQKFDFAFAPDYDPAQWNRDLIDCFILVKGDMPVTLKLR